MKLDKEQLKVLIMKQINKMEEKGFDLDAWKKSTIIILEKIFGPHDNRIEAIASLHYDYGSWSLRDTTGKTMTKESCIKTGKAILETALDEVDVFGLDAGKLQQASKEAIENIIKILDEELRGSELRAVKKALDEKSSNDNEAVEQIAMVIRNFGENSAATVLARILIENKVGKSM
ncbi:MAG: hypothetical protein RQ866_01725 [Bacteroidales bacterium]|nr:hypothetical protein [Bacteroidales bacterium]